MLLALRKSAYCALVMSYLLMRKAVRGTECSLSSEFLYNSVAGLPMVKVPAGMAEVGRVEKTKLMALLLAGVSGTEAM